MPFNTVHMAIEVPNIQNEYRWLNGVLGWPMYKTVDRAHAGTDEKQYGSSWATFGACKWPTNPTIIS